MGSGKILVGYMDLEIVADNFRGGKKGIEYSDFYRDILASLDVKEDID